MEDRKGSRIFDQITEISEPPEEEREALHSTESLHKWLEERKARLRVSLTRITLDECAPWYYDTDEGCIRNESGSFFKISGIRQTYNGKIRLQQPIIEQNEIGFLGILCCKIGGLWHYLMQAKIEPGNVNVVQLSPTLQATKSNFTGRHGGKLPAFLDYFTEMDTADIIVDQIQSEQSSRFLKKRNRNVILMVDDALAEPDSHRWMTLAQIKEMMRHDNLVNMDTRTVLSCIPYVLMGQDGDVPFRNKPYFYKTAWSMDRRTIADLYHQINNYKMFMEQTTERVPLFELAGWSMKGNAFCCERPYPFHIVFCDINIEGREVTHWRQPLFAAGGNALFGLFCCDDDGVMKFLVKIAPEVGCFDGAEIGPTVQREAFAEQEPDSVEALFTQRLRSGREVIVDTILSEEGGRFYQEENRNAILYIDKKELGELPPGYVWSDYGTLNILTQVNNCLNIQLRNLLSLLEV